jgi:hypothetical protein
MHPTGVKNREGKMLKSWFCVARMVNSLNLLHRTGRVHFGCIQHLSFVRDPPIKQAESISAGTEEYLSIGANGSQHHIGVSQY